MKQVKLGHSLFDLLKKEEEIKVRVCSNMLLNSVEISRNLEELRTELARKMPKKEK